ncbi:MAG: hypothetical protein HDQ97_02745 [Lachnospiraceae bacterium]|nr:hypothetical protein [Lachnospiraceae bacterium]
MRNTDAIPSEESNRYLLQHRQELCKEYQKRLEVEGKEAKEVINIIYEKLKEMLDEPFSQVENIIDRTGSIIWAYNKLGK